MRFLISRLSALGDTVCTLPAATALKNSFPGCQVVWAVDNRFKAVVECCPSVDAVVPVNPKDLNQLPSDLQGDFDAAFDLQGLLKSGSILKKVKAKAKLGFHWQREGAWMFSAPVAPDPTSLHVVDQYVDVVRAFGAQADRAEFNLMPDPEAKVAVTKLLADKGCEGKYVVMNPGAGWANKRWRPDYFAKIIADLKELGYDPVLIGGKAPADIAARDEVLSACKVPPYELVGQTNIKELIALIAGCAAHLGGDTGSTHIAAALGRPAVGLYGPTRPQRTCPYGQIENCLWQPRGLAYIQTAPVMQLLEKVLA